MLRLAILFLVIALIAALFGFGMIAAISLDIAKVMFFVFIVLFVVFGIIAWFERKEEHLPDASVQDVRDAILGKSRAEGDS